MRLILQRRSVTLSLHYKCTISHYYWRLSITSCNNKGEREREGGREREEWREGGRERGREGGREGLADALI